MSPGSATRRAVSSGWVARCHSAVPMLLQVVSMPAIMRSATIPSTRRSGRGSPSWLGRNELADEVASRFGLAALELGDEVGAEALLAPQVPLRVVAELEHVAHPAGEFVRHRLGHPQDVADDPDRDLLGVVGGGVGAAGAEEPLDVAPAELAGHRLVAGHAGVGEPGQDQPPRPGVQGWIGGDGREAVEVLDLLLPLGLGVVDDADLAGAEPLDVVGGFHDVGVAGEQPRAAPALGVGDGAGAPEVVPDGEGILDVPLVEQLKVR